MDPLRTNDGSEAKDAAIKELAVALKCLIQQITPPLTQLRPKSRTKEWANSPFVVTVLGGLLLAMVTCIFQAFQVRSTRIMAQGVAAK